MVIKGQINLTMETVLAKFAFYHQLCLAFKLILCPDGSNVHNPIYADGSVFTSHLPSGLQNSFRTLRRFSEDLLLQISPNSNGKYCRFTFFLVSPNEDLFEFQSRVNIQIFNLPNISSLNK